MKSRKIKVDEHAVADLDYKKRKIQCNYSGKVISRFCHHLGGIHEGTTKRKILIKNRIQFCE